MAPLTPWQMVLFPVLTLGTMIGLLCCAVLLVGLIDSKTRRREEPV